VNHAARLEAVRAGLEAAEADAVVVTAPANIRYLTGFAGSNGLVVVPAAGPATLLTDFRYRTAAEPLRAWVDVHLAERDVIRTAAERLGELTGGAARVGFEPAQLTVERHALLAAAHGRLVPVPGLVERLRMVKDADELAAVRASAAMIEPVCRRLVAEGLVGRSETDVAWRVRELFHEAGADDLSFPTIVASHERGAQPHATPTAVRIGAGTLVTIDLGCMLGGYASDCTRTFATGALPAELEAIYAVCLEAQLAAMAAVGPGVPAADVDAAARSVIERAGHGERFGHPVGHGVGLEIHEAPRLSAASSATLEPGMVVTVEPGIYLPGSGGVRIEDLLVVTETGAERLTMYPKQLTVVG
jgi:Xaa-Pro aminopeptidase